MKYLLLCAVLVAYVEAATMPTYISRCCINTPGCIVSQARRDILNILSGDLKYNVPNYLPYRVAQITLLNNEAGTMILNTLRLWHLDTITINSLKPYLEKRYGECEYHFLRLRLEFSYSMNIFDTPLQKCGGGEIILDDVSLKHIVSFEFDDEKYAYMKESSVTFTAGSIVYNLRNLDDEAQEYLEDKYDYVNELMRPGLEKFLDTVVLSPFTAYGDSVKFLHAFNSGAECNAS